MITRRYLRTMWFSRGLGRKRMWDALAGLELAISLVDACEGIDGDQLDSVIGTLPTLPPITESTLDGLEFRRDLVLTAGPASTGDLLAIAHARLRRVLGTIDAGAWERPGELAESSFLLVALDLGEVADLIRRLDAPLDDHQREALDVLSSGSLDDARALCPTTGSRA